MRARRCSPPHPFMLCRCISGERRAPLCPAKHVAPHPAHILPPPLTGRRPSSAPTFSIGRRAHREACVVIVTAAYPRRNLRQKDLSGARHTACGSQRAHRTLRSLTESMHDLWPLTVWRPIEFRAPPQTTGRSVSSYLPSSIDCLHPCTDLKALVKSSSVMNGGTFVTFSERCVRSGRADRSIEALSTVAHLSRHRSVRMYQYICSRSS